MRAFHAFALAALIATPALPAIAQDGDNDGWIVSIGGGGAYVPSFPGAREMELSPLPLFDLRRAGTDRTFETPDESFGPAIISGGNFRAGPALSFMNGRDEEDAIVGIGDVGTTVEIGAFAEAYMTDSLRLRAEVRKGLGGHKGLVGDAGADFIVGKPAGTHFSIGPRVRFADSRYVRAFYGINPNQSAATGLPVYDVNGGLHSAGALAFARHQLTPDIGVEAYGRYDRLLGDAADSPLVRSSVGSRNQYEVGLGLTYSFGIRL